MTYVVTNPNNPFHYKRFYYAFISSGASIGFLFYLAGPLGMSYGKTWTAFTFAAANVLYCAWRNFKNVHFNEHPVSRFIANAGGFLILFNLFNALITNEYNTNYEQSARETTKRFFLYLIPLLASWCFTFTVNHEKHPVCRAIRQASSTTSATGGMFFHLAFMFGLSGFNKKAFGWASMAITAYAWIIGARLNYLRLQEKAPKDFNALDRFNNSLFNVIMFFADLLNGSTAMMMVGAYSPYRTGYDWHKSVEDNTWQIVTNIAALIIGVYGVTCGIYLRQVEAAAAASAPTPPKRFPFQHAESRMQISTSPESTPASLRNGTVRYTPVDPTAGIELAAIA